MSELPPEEAEALRDVLAYVRRQRGLDTGQYKETFLSRRLAVRLRAAGVANYQDYLQLLRHPASGPAELDALLNALTINLSYFFRDLPAFDALRDRVLAPLIAARSAGRRRRLALWSAGCATGEEPYSLAILLAELLGDELARWELVIHATDLDADALEKAGRAAYGPLSFSPAGGPLPETLRGRLVPRFLQPAGDLYTVHSAIRRLVTFTPHDLTQTPPLACYDLIVCRNVLIYFARESQQPAVEHLLGHLEPDGYLMLGMTEMLPLDVAGQVQAIDARHRLYQKTKARVQS